MMQALMNNRAPIGMQTKGLFGKSGRFFPAPEEGEAQPRMPGPISGFGGGTFNMDGSQATPVDAVPMGSQMPAPQPQAPMQIPDQGAGPSMGSNGMQDAPAQGLGARMQPPPGGPLGASMRQPFDYDAAMKALTGEYKKPNGWQIAAAIVGDTAANMSGRQGSAIDSILGRKNAHAQRQFEAAKQIMSWQQGDYAAQRDADLRAANPFTIGRDRVQFDPRSGKSSVLFDGAEDFELYAEGLGLEPGSEDYFNAVEDFILRGSGPSAYERDVSLDDHRTGNDRGLEGYRQENRLEMERARQGNRLGMEGARQDNRMTLRQTPSAGRAGGAAIQAVSTPAEAQKLKPGTRYRTPDGKVYTR